LVKWLIVIPAKAGIHSPINHIAFNIARK
jgi:hypothetical protein